MFYFLKIKNVIDKLIFSQNFFFNFRFKLSIWRNHLFAKMRSPNSGDKINHPKLFQCQAQQTDHFSSGHFISPNKQKMLFASFLKKKKEIKEINIFHNILWNLFIKMDNKKTLQIINQKPIEHQTTVRSFCSDEQYFI